MKLKQSFGQIIVILGPISDSAWKLLNFLQFVTMELQLTSSMAAVTLPCTFKMLNYVYKFG